MEFQAESAGVRCGMVNEIQKVFLTNGRDWIEIFIQSVVPVLIMIITLIVSKNQQKQALAQQAEEHKAEMMQQKESTRLSVLPIFNFVSISGEMEPMASLSSSQLQRHILKLQLENVGAGIAMSPYIKWNEIEGVVKSHPFCETDTAYYCCYKDIPYENMVAAPGKALEVQIVRNPKGEDFPVEDFFVLPIGFSDMLGHKYEQRIAVTFYILKDRNVTVTNISAITPVLLADSEQQSAGK